jgi:hypothetical protein
LEEKQEGAKTGLNRVFYTRKIEQLREPIEFIRPMSDENQRLANQGGLFTGAPLGSTLVDWVKDNFLGDNTYTLMV